MRAVFLRLCGGCTSWFCRYTW